MEQDSKPPILVVDDEEEILQSLHRLLRLEFEVHTAKTGLEALEILQQQPIHVVLSDQRMPEMVGVELLRQSQNKRPRAIRIMFTGYADLQAVINAINHGQIYRYLIKPWNAEELLTVLREASTEYTRRFEEWSLFNELQDYQLRCLALIEGLQEARFGTLNEDGEEEVLEIAKVGYALLDRFDRALGFVTDEGGGG